MKRTLALVPLSLALALAFLLCACARERAPQVYTTEIDGKQAVVSKEEGTIAVGNDIYRYAYSADGVLLIVYPNGYCFSRKATTAGGMTAYATSFDAPDGTPSDKSEEEFGYIGGFVLAWALDHLEPSASTGEGNPALAVIMILGGLWFLISPRSAWMVGYGWRFKGAEPSDIALFVYRVIGVGLLLAAIVMLLAQ